MRAMRISGSFLALLAFVAQPVAANMIYSPNQILSNSFVVGVNSITGQFRIFAERTLDAIVDVSGYFAQ